MPYVSDDSGAAVRARDKLIQLVFGHMAALAVSTAARMRLPDLIGDREVTATELAAECGAHPPSIDRLLRALAALELLTEHRPGQFSLTTTGALLRTDRPDSANAFTLMFTDPALLQAWQLLESAIRSGRTVFEDALGTDFFSYLKADPELSAQFNAAMSQGTRMATPGLATAYGFERFDTVVDVGGGNGTLIAGILREHQALKGILFDTAEGLAQAGEVLRRAGVNERCTVRTGDFFDSVPAGGDLYLLKSVIHDWDDQRAGVILDNCRKVMPGQGRLLIVDPVLPGVVDGSVPDLMYLSDLNMLVNVGGRERTRADIDQLCQQSGFVLAGITPLPAPAMFSLVEAVPA
jgi:hypothetical protein